MMKRASILVAAAAMLCCSAAYGNPVWTETFDDGVGRFNITAGQGDTVFVHEPVNENLHATFVRRNIATESEHDRRLAELGTVFDENDVVGFTVEWSPLSNQGDWAWPLLGFFDSSSWEDVAVVRIRNPGSTGGNYRLNIRSPVSDQFVTDTGAWLFGETYRLSFQIDAPSHVLMFSTWILQGSDFVLQESNSWPLSTSLEYSFDSLGMGNILDDHIIGSTLTADFDNFSFTPEPSTAVLLMTGTLFALRRRRARSFQRN